MAGETKIKGDQNILYIYDVAATAYRPIACLTSNSLSSTVEVLETQTKCDPGNTSKDAGNFSYSISLEGEYIDSTSVGGETTKASHDYLFTRQQAKTKVTWRLDTGLTDNVAYFGTALITDLTLDSPAGDKSTFSGTFDGDGAILLVNPIV